MLVHICKGKNCGKQSRAKSGSRVLCDGSSDCSVRLTDFMRMEAVDATCFDVDSESVYKLRHTCIAKSKNAQRI